MRTARILLIVAPPRFDARLRLQSWSSTATLTILSILTASCRQREYELTTSSIPPDFICDPQTMTALNALRL
jgi:hypothetical protein